jgi:transcriptional regulator with XRE-family HTH domain
VEDRDDSSARIEFGRQLKAYREAAGISQGALAKALMKQQPYIVNIEKGETGIGIDKMEEISSFFGMKYYDFANPKFPIPPKAELRENMRKYLILHQIDPSYLDNENAPKYAKKLDLYLATGKLNEQKSSYEIAKEYQEMFDEHIEPSKVTDILTKAPRNEKIEVTKPATGRGNLYKLKAPKQG